MANTRRDWCGNSKPFSRLIEQQLNVCATGEAWGKFRANHGGNVWL